MAGQPCLPLQLFCYWNTKVVCHCSNNASICPWLGSVIVLAMITCLSSQNYALQNAAFDIQI